MPKDRTEKCLLFLNVKCFYVYLFGSVSIRKSEITCVISGVLIVMLIVCMLTHTNGRTPNSENYTLYDKKFEDT